MDRRLADLLRLLELERIEINLFRGESRDIGAPQVFGGQVLGQALVAAYATVEARIVHSLHAYFLRPGDFNAPIVYEVDRSRDGQSFSSRRVTAIQHGEQIFNMAASFQAPQQGVEHQIPMPKVPPPEDLKDMETHHREMIPQIPEKLRRLFEHQRPFEFRPVRVPDYFKREKLEPIKHVWFRAVDSAAAPIRRCNAACWRTCRIITCSTPRLCRTAFLAAQRCAPRQHRSRHVVSCRRADRRLVALFD